MLGLEATSSLGCFGSVGMQRIQIRRGSRKRRVKMRRGEREPGGTSAAWGWRNRTVLVPAAFQHRGQRHAHLPLFFL